MAEVMGAKVGGGGRGRCIVPSWESAAPAWDRLEASRPLHARLREGFHAEVVCVAVEGSSKATARLHFHGACMLFLT
jgi:hypothetical protein